MFVVLRYSSHISPTTFIRFGVSSVRTSVHNAGAGHEKQSNTIPVGSLVNDQLFDKLVRKPYQNQQFTPKHISNMKFAEIILKHGFFDTALVVCSTIGACVLCSQFGWISSGLLQSFGDPSFFLNKIFPFLQHISSVPMRNTYELFMLVSPLWLAESIGLSWLGCKRELNKLYAKYEKENEELLIEEKPGFIQSCSLEDGCSMRFYGDECQHGNNRKFTKKSEKSNFYDGYGGDCSFKASNNK